MPCRGRLRRALGTWCVPAILSVLIYASSPFSLAHASATLLLEEPYGKLGFFTATGHAAVYLSGVCAETPLVLRACGPGELGAVISRYNGVGGYDWVAIPLIPYLYALDRPEDVPLYADPKMVNFLRDQYRRAHLEAVAPDLAGGETPGGNWYELVGSAYDRSAYGFEIETSPEQDAAFIRAYNSAPNRSHFRTVSSNCADFAKHVINFYYPKSLHRSVVADVGITTPKQMARTIVKFSARHPDLLFSRFVIPQVPGSEARSTPVHGVVESYFKSKKYILPSAVVSPIFAGSVAAVYIGTSMGRFDPARQALVYNADRPLEKPLAAEDRRYYQSELNRLMAERLKAENASEAESPRIEKFGRLLRNASPGFDAQGRPVLAIRLGEAVVNVGVSESNILEKENDELASQAAASGVGQIREQILENRLREELRHGAPSKVSESDVARDWKLLRKVVDRFGEQQVASGPARSMLQGSQARLERAGNQP